MGALWMVSVAEVAVLGLPRPLQDISVSHSVESPGSSAVARSKSFSRQLRRVVTS